MSRVPRKPVSLPQGIECIINDGEIIVKGPKGTLKHILNDDAVEVKVEPTGVFFKATNDIYQAQAGTVKAIVKSMIEGVNIGFVRKLQLVGVGYKAQVQNKVLNLVLGYSHPINYVIPEGISIETPTQTEILIKGIDKYLVGQVAANIRAYRLPEPYKGKGVRYEDEVIILKEGKKK